MNLVYAAHRFDVLPSRIARFKATFHSLEGQWNEIAQNLPGHIVTHLIQHGAGAGPIATAVDLRLWPST